MRTAYLTNRAVKKGLLVVATSNVVHELNESQLSQAWQQLREKMKTPDPENPNLWTVIIDDRKIWGILDEGAGPRGEDDRGADLRPQQRPGEDPDGRAQ